MIRNKEELIYYLDCDRIALDKPYKRPRIFHDAIWSYQIDLRKSEYWTNCGKGVIGKICEKYYKAKVVLKGQRLGFSIGLNTCGPGLALVHYGCTVIHQNAHLGENCRVHEGVTIGSNASAEKAPQIGNNVYIASGAKIIGDISIADGVCIGANAVVVRSITESNVTYAGVPAKKVSENGSSDYLVKATAIVKKGKTR